MDNIDLTEIQELAQHRGPEQLAAVPDMSPTDAFRGVGSVLSGRSPPVSRIFFLAYALLSFLPMNAIGQEFHVDRDADNDVRFTSQAPIEEVVGVTDRIDGYVLLNGPRLEPGSAPEGTQLYLEVDLASLDTGLGLRNRHMRNNYLEVEEFPYAFFDATIERVEATAAGVFRVMARGVMNIHGVERSVDIPCDVVERGEGYRVQCVFNVLLSDFDIEIPKIMFLKLANEARLELDFTVRPAPDL